MVRRLLKCGHTEPPVHAEHSLSAQESVVARPAADTSRRVVLDDPVGVDAHRPELERVEGFSTAPDDTPPMEERARRGTLDGDD